MEKYDSVDLVKQENRKENTFYFLLHKCLFCFLNTTIVLLIAILFFISFLKLNTISLLNFGF